MIPKDPPKKVRPKAPKLRNASVYDPATGEWTSPDEEFSETEKPYGDQVVPEMATQAMEPIKSDPMAAAPPSEYGQLAPPTAPPSLDPVIEKQNKIRGMMDTPAEKQSKWKQGLWWGLQGVREAFNPGSGNLQYLGEAKKDYAIQKEMGQLAPLTSFRNENQKYNMGQVGLETAQAGAKVAGIEAIMASNPDLAANLRAGAWDQSQVDRFNAATGASTQPFDVMPRVREDVNGIQQETPALGPARFTPTNRPPSLRDVPIQQTDPNTGMPMYVNSREAAELANRGSASQNPNTDINDDIDTVNTDMEEDAKIQDYNDEIAGKRKGLDKQISDAYAQLQILAQEVKDTGAAADRARGSLTEDPNELYKRQQDAYRRMMDLRSKISEMEAQREELVPRRPRNPRIRRQEVKGRGRSKTITRKQLEDTAKRRGISVEDLLKLPGAEKYRVVN